MTRKTFRELKQRKLSRARQREVDAAIERELLELDLRALRQLRGATQTELALRADMTQPDISRLERRDDYHVSTLRRVVEALGGELELIANFGDVRVRIR